MDTPLMSLPTQISGQFWHSKKWILFYLQFLFSTLLGMDRLFRMNRINVGMDREGREMNSHDWHGFQVKQTEPITYHNNLCTQPMLH